MRFTLAKQQLYKCITLLFLYITLPLLHDYDVKMPNFTWTIVCYTVVFSVVTQRSSRGALRDDTKNGCVADYLEDDVNISRQDKDFLFLYLNFDVVF